MNKIIIISLVCTVFLVTMPFEVNALNLLPVSQISEGKMTLPISQGRPRDDLTSTIPKGTKLLSLKVRGDGVHVDLSPEFRSGGGSTSMIYRAAQVIYTSTSLDPNAKVFISVGGQSIDSNHPLGGEGLILQQPTTRAQFAADFL
jgi:spore germination protein GerM